MSEFFLKTYISAKLKAEALAADQRGATLVEYVILAACMAAVAFVLFGTNGTMRNALQGAITTINQKLDGVGG